MGNPGTRYYILMSRVPKYCGSPGGTEPNRVYRTVRYNSENRCIPSEHYQDKKGSMDSFGQRIEVITSFFYFLHFEGTIDKVTHFVLCLLMVVPES